MKITVLTENTAKDSFFIAEHGLSLYIETEGTVFLFDTGQTDTMLRNAETLGIDLNRADFVILSHGHYDHGGGISRFLQVNDHAPVYMNRNAFGAHYNGMKYIGLDPALKESDRIIYTDDEMVLNDTMTLLTCNERRLSRPVNAYGLTVRENGREIPDPFKHEQYLLVNEHGKRILFSGCSHKGILNIMEQLKPDVLIGGFHFKKIRVQSEEAKVLDEAAEVLNTYDTEYYTCHCTGEEQYEYLKERMGEKLHRLRAGDVITL